MKKQFWTLIITTLLIASNTISQIEADSALQLLVDGNKRFISGTTIKPHQDINRVLETSGKQQPFAIIVGCSDSRVPNEIIFDQGLGDLFIIRTAGQVSSYASWGSIEFANAVLGTKLIVVQGHSQCGAVSAACKVPDVPGHIVTLINAIKPAAAIARAMKGDLLENAVKVNVALQVQQLRGLEPVLAKAVAQGDLKIVGAVYHIENGTVEFLDETFIQSMNNN